MPKDVILPPLFGVNETVNGNEIRQLILPTATVSADTATYTSPLIKGNILIHANGDNKRTLLVSKAYDQYPSFDEVIFIPKNIATSDGTDLAECRWLRHPQQHPVKVIADELEAVSTSWRDGFAFIEEVEDEKSGDISKEGLREPQIGALHAVHAHWSVSNEAATIVMPTGTGKTETMISVLVSKACKKVLIVVPTDALRNQIADKFLTFGLLQKFGVISRSCRFPIVGILRRKPKDLQEVDDIFAKCHVIVGTSHIVGQSAMKVQQRMAYHCSDLFIDEAHHVAAPTWNRFKDAFKDRRILQFTATPYREDDKSVGNKFIYIYSLKRAQEKKYFTKINFKTVNVYLPRKRDQAIAELAVQQLREDRENYPHILMARVNSIPRAKEVFQIYKKYPEFNPVLLHSEMSVKERREGKEQLVSGDAKIVVCVDMLGEGFDLPTLKIAAFHDIRKSPAVTIQLAGRFTRSRKDLGTATFIANVGNPEVRDELKKLYSREPDWNYLLPKLSEELIAERVDLNALSEGFKSFHSEIPIQSLTPAMSTVIYQTSCEEWNPDNYLKGLIGIDAFDKQFHDINREKNTLLIVTSRKKSVEWTSIEDVYSIEWTLYVVFWDKTQNLLFINNSTNEGHFKKLAAAVCGEDVELLRGNELFRSLGKMTRITFKNVGLSEQGMISFISRMGSDVEAALSQIQIEKATKSVLVGSGFEDGKRVTIGCSANGRVWNQARSYDLNLMLAWCSRLGAKILDESIDPDEFLKNTLGSKYVSSRPEKMPFGVDWNEDVYKEMETAFIFRFLDGDFEAGLYELNLNLIEASTDGPLRFQLEADDWSASYTLILKGSGKKVDFRIEGTSGENVTVTKGKTTVSAEQFFRDNPPVFRFLDGSFLSGNRYVFPMKNLDRYPIEKIEAWDWTGTSLNKESQGLEKATDSVQFKVLQYLKAKDYDLIFDDDDKGEAADIVAVKVDDDNSTLDVEFYHCKFSKKLYSGSRVDDLYQVCGQAQTSIRWMRDVDKLYSHLRLREEKQLDKHSASRIERGNLDLIDELIGKSPRYRTRLKIVAVQPGLKKSKVSATQLELLGVTDSFLRETYRIPFVVIGNSAE